MVVRVSRSFIGSLNPERAQSMAQGHDDRTTTNGGEERNAQQNQGRKRARGRGPQVRSTGLSVPILCPKP